VTVLVIDGDPAKANTPEGDAYYLRNLFSSGGGFRAEAGTRSDLERPNLDSYPSIYFLNIQDFSDKAVTNLENYLKGGGGVTFFRGEKVNPNFSTEKLYAKGKGLFPVPLAAQPPRKLSPKKKEEKQTQKWQAPRQQIYLRSDSHPIFAEIYK